MTGPGTGARRSTLRGGGEGLDEGDAVLRDSELAPERLMGAGPGLEDGDRPAEFVTFPQVLKQNDVVRQVRDAELRELHEVKELGYLVRHQQAYLKPGTALHQRVHVFPEA